MSADDSMDRLLALAKGQVNSPDRRNARTPSSMLPTACGMRRGRPDGVEVVQDRRGDHKADLSGPDRRRPFDGAKDIVYSTSQIQFEI